MSDLYLPLNLWFEVILRRPYLELEDLYRMRRVCKSFAVHDKLVAFIKDWTDAVFSSIHRQHWNRMCDITDGSFMSIERDIWAGDLFICQHVDTSPGNRTFQFVVFSQKQMLVDHFKAHYTMFRDEGYWKLPVTSGAGVVYGKQTSISYEYYGITIEIFTHEAEYTP